MKLEQFSPSAHEPRLSRKQKLGDGKDRNEVHNVLEAEWRKEIWTFGNTSLETDTEVMSSLKFMFSTGCYKELLKCLCVQTWPPDG